MSDPKDRIQYDGDQLDEVVLTDCMFHIERMDHHGWWMAAYRDDKRISFWFRMMNEPVVLQDSGPMPNLRVVQRPPLVYPCPFAWTDHLEIGHRCEVGEFASEHVEHKGRHRCECGATKRAEATA